MTAKHGDINTVISQLQLDDQTINELLRFVPRPLVKSRRPFKGYTKSRQTDIISSNMTAGEYYPVEATFLPDQFWSQCLDLISSSFHLDISNLSGVRCQLNCIPFHALYHPLSIAPHSDSISRNVDVAAVNIPLSSQMPFQTAFWSHRVWGTGLDNFDLLGAEHKNSLIDDCGPFSASRLLAILDDNPEFTTSSEIKLRDWTLQEVVETKLGELCAYNGRTFHSPYLLRCKTNTSAFIGPFSDLRVSLAIFIIFSRAGRSGYASYAQDEWLSVELLHHKVKKSLLQLDNSYSTYKS
ncbi:hypothetical protein KBY65_05290 [Cyanobium sp. Alchichica 3B3-8F6]|nr:hypothetical protein [Cyanobium sp. Alchichica 3B3-8F6]